MTNTQLLWVIFGVGIIAIFALDMGVFNRKAKTPSLKQAGFFSALWLTVALAFSGGIMHFKGHTAGMQFLGGYVVELSLSADNVFLFAVIFRYFRTPPQVQHRVLFWGILSAVVLRGLLIGLGAALIAQYHWVEYIFGAFLLYTGIRMFLSKDEEPDISQNKLMNWAKSRLPLLDRYEGAAFFVKQNGKTFATLLFLVLMIVESTDLIFALDSIPAIFGVTKDPFIIFTSNILAILGLRSLYFLLAGVMDMFHYLQVGLSIILAFVGLKMLAVIFNIHISIGYSLVFIFATLIISIVASVLRKKG